jgi:hypothetical protein
MRRNEFSAALCVYTAAVILSSPFGRAVYNFLIESLGREMVVALIWVTFCGAVAIIWRELWLASRSGRLRFIAIVLIGVVYAASFDMPEERMHLVIFGAFGWLYVKHNYERYGASAILRVAAVALAVGAVDESLQSVTPGRVGDVRDVIFNGVGAVWGGALAAALCGAGRPRIT